MESPWSVARGLEPAGALVRIYSKESTSAALFDWINLSCLPPRLLPLHFAPSHHRIKPARGSFDKLWFSCKENNLHWKLHWPIMGKNTNPYRRSYRNRMLVWDKIKQWKQTETPAVTKIVGKSSALSATSQRERINSRLKSKWDTFKSTQRGLRSHSNTIQKCRK